MDKGHIAQAWIDRLGAQQVRHRVLGVDGSMEIAVARDELDRMPELIAAFCRELDLRLVHLASPEHDAWHAGLAWSDEVGRPRLLKLELFGDWCHGPRRMLRSEELLAAPPDVRFIHGVLKLSLNGSAAALEGENLSRLWEQEPRGAMEQVACFFRHASDMRLVAQAAKHKDWSGVRAELPRLKRAAARATPFHPAAVLGSALRLAANALAPQGASIAFIGESRVRREAVQDAVERDLGATLPGGLDLQAHGLGEDDSADLRIVFDDAGYAALLDDAIAVDSGQPLPGLLAEVELAILRWLECRVERRYPDALVGRNPRAARVLQWVSRMQLPLVLPLVEVIFNSELKSALRAPILMPHPYGIVIEPGVEIGNRVTIMQQASIGPSPAGGPPGAPIIEDNVHVGPGARIIGPVRVGRNAVIGANAVVTRDVPSHCTVVGVNHVLGGPERRVVATTRRDIGITVVNS